MKKDLLEVVRLTGPLGKSINGNKWGGGKWEKKSIRRKDRRKD